MPVEAIEPQRLYRQVADQLRRLIERGEFLPGDRLPTERELAEQLGISRPTVREALIALEVEGWVRIRVGSGIYVTERERQAKAWPVSSAAAAPLEGPFELLSARAFVEGAVAERAATVAGAEQIAALDAAIARMEACGRVDDEMIALDRAFHVALAAILGNAVLVRFVGELFDQRINPYFQQLSAYFENADTWREAIAEHKAIRDAIAARDPRGARAAVERHLDRSQRRFSGTFDEPSTRRGGRAPGAANSGTKTRGASRKERK